MVISFGRRDWILVNFFFFLLKDYAKRNRNFMNILIEDSWAVLFYLLETPLLQTAGSAFPERRKERRKTRDVE